MRQPLVHFTLLVYFLSLFFFFFFNDTATTEIYTLSLHDALPISSRIGRPWPAVTDSCIPMTNGTMGARLATLLPATVGPIAARLAASQRRVASRTVAQGRGWPAS